ncbi:MAG: hypothetical protein K5770_16775 [Lachnospiraceae bacterium]|nr:hypothetical protein [Lachnospiraceae bacterium]
MKITESTITMSSSRSYMQSGSRVKNGVNKSFYETANSYVSSEENKSNGSDMYTKGDNEGLSLQDYYPVTYNNINNIKKNMLQKATEFQNSVFQMIMGRISGGLFGGNTMHFVTYQEYENTSFHANGQAKTEDGRTIDFNVDIMMSRSYMEYMDVHIPAMQNALCDPLVINVGSDYADVKDQKFMFDIDSDGIEDEISMLGRESGFLALDKNGDGTINDGNELFGTKSGDGFADLKEYDSDGNGWIDEYDEVFSKLKVWCKGDNGEDILMDLKDADIGAIYLGSTDTEFTFGGSDGIRDGVIRSTGFFLKESSGAGTVQHVDMAIGSDDTYAVQGDDVIQALTVDRGNSSAQTNRQRENAQKVRREKALAKKRADDKRLKKQLEHRREQKDLLNRRYTESLQRAAI